jgi:hypothetical protein
VPRFLSAEWFSQIGEPGQPGRGAQQPDFVVDVVVAGAPEGEVRYQLVVEGARTRTVAPGEAAWPAQLRLASDYATMSEIASGRLSAFDALAAGRAKISGDTSRLSSFSFVGLDLVPPALRAATTY